MISIFAGGDSRFFWPENIRNFVTLPFAWDASLNTGIGKSALSSLWINSYLNFTATFSRIGLSWEIISLIFWILPGVLLSFFSSFFLFKTFFKLQFQYSLLAGLIYAFNTYFLMIFAGGQLGVALSYSLVPLVFLIFVRSIKVTNLSNSLTSALTLSLQILFDPRLSYITMLAVFIYFAVAQRKERLKRFMLVFIIPFVIAVFLHSYWILPMLIFKSSPLPQGLDSLGGFKFYSFADFSHTLSLLHPNWPENIFGKTYFLQPEFLLLPILAYSSLLFLKNSKFKIQNSKLQLKSQKLENNLTIEQFNNRAILFFALLGLIGSFLAKGVNEPFGEVNAWLFQYFPGMSMFRDPTKLYLLIAISYSVLIPFSIYNIYSWLISNFKFQISNKHFKFKIYYVFLLFTIYYLLFLIRPLWMGELRDKIKPRNVPKEYVQLKDFLVGDRRFFRTLWIPVWQRFGYFSNNHPAIGRHELLKLSSVSGQIKELKQESTRKLMEDLAVKYVVIPYDSEGEIFLEDRKYDKKKYQETVMSLEEIGWLKRVKTFGKIVVFELPTPKDHFWSPSTTLRINYGSVKPTKYKVQVRNANKGDLLVFSEGFDKNWIAKNSEFRLHSLEFKNKLNSFILPQNDNYEFAVYYEPQKWVNIGLAISGVTFVLVIALSVGFALLKMVKYTYG